MRLIASIARMPVFAQIDLKKAVISILDGVAEEINVTIGEGNLTWTERKNIEYTLDRGLLDEVRETDEVPVDISIDAVWEYIRGPSAASTTTTGLPTISDALQQLGAAVDWVSSDADTCRPYAVDLKIVYTPTPWNCGDIETITFADFRYEEMSHDLRAGTIAISGRCNITKPTVVRSAQSSP